MILIIGLAVFLVTVAIPCDTVFGQTQNGATNKEDDDVPIRTVIHKKGEIDFTYLNSGEAVKQLAIESVRRGFGRQDALVFVNFEYLYRRCSLKNGELMDPEYETGKICEDFVSGDLQLTNVKFVSKVESAQRDESKSFGKEWQAEKDRIEKFIQSQHAKKDYFPTDFPLNSVGNYFSLEEFRPSLSSGGSFIGTSEMSMKITLNSQAVTIGLPGQSVPEWAHYIDARVVGFANSSELRKGDSLENVFLRYNTAIPISMEKHNNKDLVSIAFGQYYVRRILFDPMQGYLPTHTLSFRGGMAEKGVKATVVQGPINQSWLKAVKVGDSWVAERLMILEPTTLVDVEFKWWTVNGDPPQNAFTVESLGLAPGTRIIDNRTIPPTVSVLP